MSPERAPRDVDPAVVVEGTEQRVVRRVALQIVALAVIAPVLAALAGAPSRVTLGIVVGGLLSAANFVVIERISAKVVRGTVRTQSILMGLLVLKMSVLMVAVYLLVRTFGIDAVGFVIGLSTLVLGLAIEGFRTVLRPGARESA